MKENEKIEQNTTENKSIKDIKKKKVEKKKIPNNDSLIEKYYDSVSEKKINYNETSHESIFDNEENYDNIFQDFIASNKFNGKKNGYIFKNDTQGLGYYYDKNKQNLHPVTNIYLN